MQVHIVTLDVRLGIESHVPFGIILSNFQLSLDVRLDAVIRRTCNDLLRVLLPPTNLYLRTVVSTTQNNIAKLKSLKV